MAPEPKFTAGVTPCWGEYAFKCNGEFVEGLREVQCGPRGYGLVYARDHNGNWPIFTPAGLPLLYRIEGYWEAVSVYPPDNEFDEPRGKDKA